MTAREGILIREFEDIKKHNDVVSNKEVFYIMNNHGENRFKDQEECDNLLAKLISESSFFSDAIAFFMLLPSLIQNSS